jgi:hypothetical protein
MVAVYVLPQVAPTNTANFSESTAGSTHPAKDSCALPTTAAWDLPSRSKIEHTTPISKQQQMFTHPDLPLSGTVDHPDNNANYPL